MCVHVCVEEEGKRRRYESSAAFRAAFSSLSFCVSFGSFFPFFSLRTRDSPAEEYRHQHMKKGKRKECFSVIRILGEVAG